MANKPFSRVLYAKRRAFRHIRYLAPFLDIVFGAGRSTPAGHAQPERERLSIGEKEIRQEKSNNYEVVRAHSTAWTPVSTM
jgi:hypothetical protein